MEYLTNMKSFLKMYTEHFPTHLYRGVGVARLKYNNAC